MVEEHGAGNRAPANQKGKITSSQQCVGGRCQAPAGGEEKINTTNEQQDLKNKNHRGGGGVCSQTFYLQIGVKRRDPSMKHFLRKPKVE